MLKIAVLVSGGGTNLQAIIDGVESGKIQDTKIVTVISNRKNAFGLERARKHNIDAKCLRPMDFEKREDYDAALIAYLMEKKVDLVVLAGYLAILSDSFVKTFENRIMNIHPSLIPAFCGDGFYGLKVHEEALNRGVKVTGATVHFVDEGTDTGPIVLQKAVDVLEGDTPESLQLRVMEEAEWTILPQAIDLYAGGRIVVENGKAKILKK